MPKYRPGNLNLAQFWLRLPLEMKELNQLLNHNLSKMGKKKGREKRKKNQNPVWCCSRNQEIRNQCVYSNFLDSLPCFLTGRRIKQSPVWRCDQCQPTALTSHWHTGWKTSGAKPPWDFHPPKNHQEKQVWGRASTKFCPKCDPFIHSCGAEELLPTLQSPQDILSLRTCQKRTVWSQ